MQSNDALGWLKEILSGLPQEVLLMKIWIDDIRPMPSGYDIHCQSVNDTIGVIEYIEMKQKEKIDLLDIDHDAGDFRGDGGDYIKILDWLEEKNISIPIRIHSGNIVGRQNMERIIKHNGWTLIS